uniref:Sortilin-related receptor n=1 Tax=Corethrella appendiculata TaxID=1370023 RepID=W4VRP1_9DIPT
MARCYCKIFTIFLLILPSYQSVRHGFPPEFLFSSSEEYVNRPKIFHSNSEESSVIANRMKRNAILPTSNDSDLNKKNITTRVNALNDSHAQLMVHWLGEGTDVMICLAREPPLGPLDDPKTLPPPSPSSIFISHDYGDTFVDKTEMFRLNISGKLISSTVDQFMTHPKFNTIVFTDPRNKALFTSNDYGKTIKNHLLEFRPSDVSYYELDTKTFLVLDKEDPERKLYYTTDFGESFNLLQSYVKSFSWSSGNGLPIHLYIERKEPTNTSSVIFYNASNLLQNGPKNFNVLIQNVQDFHIKKDFMFATRKDLNNTKLLISYKRGQFIKADFQTELDIKGIHIADVEGKRIMISVVHTERISHLYVSESDQNMTDIKFVPSLENIFTYVPELNWRASWLVQTSDDAFTDLYKVEGLRGIYIASKINRVPTSETISPDYLVSLISFDHGSTWRPIAAPIVDDDGQYINCVKDCSLHLSQKFSQLYPVTRSVTIMSSKSAPGVIMASGVVGKSLKGHPGVFISRDAGLTWKQILKNYHFFNMGDHGGILVAVKYFKSKGETREILYSTDEGEKWLSHPFNSNDLKVYGLMTEPNTNTTIFTLFGSEPAEHKWLIIKIDLKNAFSSNCTEDDYKFWAPGSHSGDSFMPCILGVQETYQRRKPSANCYNGIGYERPIRTEVCPCNSWDFECDFGFTKHSQKNVACIRNKTLIDYDPFSIPKSCKPGDYYNRTKGYRKIEGDQCIDGYSSQYLPQSIPCPVTQVNEFLVVAQRDKISRINLANNSKEVFPVNGLKNVIAIEFDIHNNCVFWADIMNDVIGRQCLNGNQTVERLVYTDISSVEGMSFDWVSQLLYFVDGMNLKIEAVTTNHTKQQPHGRMRKVILDSRHLMKPRGIVVHPIQGYLFWTDWSAVKPSVSRSNLDGSDVKQLFSKPDVVWPNGVTIDFIAERLYWVDASKDYIASCDLNGKNFHKVLQQDSRLAHPFGVAVLKNLMYWDDWKMNSIFSADKDHGIMIHSIAGDMLNLMDLKIYAPSIQEGTNACSGKDQKCSHICVGAPKNSYSCLCPNGMEKNSQGQCMCPGGNFPPYANNTCPKTGNTCGSNFFSCANGICMPLVYRCDGDDDCGDKSDEEACPSDKPPCPPHMFTCKADHQCIPKYFVCDYDKDCIDGSDEQNCKAAKCKSTDFTCDNGRCISKSWVCDREDDCRDGSDEKNCTSKNSTEIVCKADEYKCNSTGTYSCIPNTWRCDGENDCTDSSDEQFCHNKTCDPWMFTCGNSHCIYKTWHCDGEQDCVDGSDEKNCSTIVDPPKKPGINFLPGDNCHDWMFKCANDKCVPFWWKCDDVNDCGDNSDEIGCANTVGSSTTTAAPIPKHNSTIQKHCNPSNEFQCNNGGCISSRYVCDMYPDCAQGEDEDNCPQPCTSRQFKCRSDGVCLDMEKYCDNKRDCVDGSDEDCKFKPINSTETNCTNNSGMFTCDNSCLPLMVLCDGRRDCIDGSDEDPIRTCNRVNNRIYQVVQIGVDERSLNSSSFLIYWWIAVPQNLTFEYLPSIYYNHEWKNISNWILQTDFRFTNLKPYTVYNVTVYVRIKGQSTVFPPFKYYEVVTSEGIPGEPTNVQTVQKNGSRVQVSWKKPKEVNGHLDGYTIFYRPQSINVGPAQSVKAGPSESSIMIESDFRGNVTYEFWVKAKNRKHESLSSKLAQLEFDATSNIDAISKIETVNQTANSIVLRWKEIKNAEGYVIQPILPHPYPNIEPIRVKEPTVTLKNMIPGTQYVIKISAYIKNYIGRHQTELLEFGGDPLPEVPNVQVTREYNSINLHWNEPKIPNVSNLEYGIYYGTNMDELLGAPKLKTNKTNAKITDFLACEAYLVSVGIVGPLGPGPLGRNPKTVNTLYNEKKPPRNLKVDINDTSREMIIQWEHSCPLQNNVAYPGYTISIQELTTHRNYRVEIKPSTNKTMQHTFNDIPRGAVYDISVSTNAKNSEMVNSIVYAPSLPAPTQLKVWAEKNGSYVVYWKEVKDFDDDKIIYEAAVYSGMLGDKVKAKPIFTIDSNVPPIHINVEDLGGSEANGKIFTIVVKLKTSQGYYSDMLESESFEVHLPEKWFANQSTTSYWWLFIIPAVIALALVLVIVYLVQRSRRTQSSFSRFANSHYDTKTGATRIGDTLDEDEHEHQEVPRSFSDDEPLVIT